MPRRTASAWATAVYRRDGHVCQVCGAIDTLLNAHHLWGRKAYPSRALDVENGVCLCAACHDRFHRSHGYGHNTPEQFRQFKQSMQSLKVMAHGPEALRLLNAGRHARRTERHNAPPQPKSVKRRQQGRRKKRKTVHPPQPQPTREQIDLLRADRDDRRTAWNRYGIVIA